MNAIPTFITSLSVLHHNVVVQLNVQCLNEVFWGTVLEQYQPQQTFSLLLPQFIQSSGQQACMADAVDEEMPSLF